METILSIIINNLSWIIPLALVLLVASFAITVRNNLVRLTNIYKTAFSNLETELTRRFDLIPNLVAATKGYLDHEKGVFVEVTEARNQASKQLNAVKNDLGNADLMGLMSKAEGALSGALGRLMAVVEAYPDLKADARMAELTLELANTENQIATLRKHYNFTIEEYNTYRQIFPNNIFSGLFGYQFAAWLPMEEHKREVPKVEF